MTAVSDETGRGYGCVFCKRPLTQDSVVWRCEPCAYSFGGIGKAPVSYVALSASPVGTVKAFGGAGEPWSDWKQDQAETTRIKPTAPVAQEAVAWILTWPDGASSITRRKPSPLIASDVMVTPAYAGTPPATSAGVGADEIARIIDDAINKYGSLMFIQEHGWAGFCTKVRQHVLALLSRGSGSDQK